MLASSAEEADDAEPMPGGGMYMVDRWVELTDDEAPWWTKPTGVGLRLQLEEIRQLAVALQGGEVVAAAIKRLLKAAGAMFSVERGYCFEKYPEVARLLTRALRDKEAAELLPGGIALAGVEAARLLLEGQDPVTQLITDTAESAGAANCLDDFLRVDERITLLDAELAFEGYSREWRAQAALAAKAALADGSSPVESLQAGLAAAGQRDLSDFDVLVPVKQYTVPEDPTTSLNLLLLDEAEERLSSWPGGGEHLAELADAEAALPLRGIHARDPDAAAEAARDQLGRVQSLWELEDGVLVLGANLLLHDLADKRTCTRPRLRRRIARPAGLKNYQAARKDKEDEASIRRLSDALDQLAQARTGSLGASLADLWTVAETLFGGVAEDKPVEVTDRVAGLTQYLYVRDFLRWLGSRLDQGEVDLEGLRREAGESQAAFGLKCVQKRADSLPPKLVAAELPLEWIRMKQVLRWDQRRKSECYLRDELRAMEDRVAAIGNRAYLVRNLFLHQGNPERAAAMAVTLPAFASILYAAVGYINRVADAYRLPLVTSVLAELQVRHVAAAYTAAPGRGPRPLPGLIDLADD